MPPTGRIGTSAGDHRAPHLPHTTAGPIISAGKAFRPSASAGAAKASVGVATPGRQIRPRALAAGDDLGLGVGRGEPIAARIGDRGDVRRAQHCPAAPMKTSANALPPHRLDAGQRLRGIEQDFDQHEPFVEQRLENQRRIRQAQAPLIHRHQRQFRHRGLKSGPPRAVLLEVTGLLAPCVNGPDPAPGKFA